MTSDRTAAPTMPAKSRSAKSTAPSPSPAATRSTRASRSAPEAAESVEEEETQEEEEEAEEEPAVVEKGKGKATDHDAVSDQGATAESQAETTAPGGKQTMEERMAKMKELRAKMNSVSAANRKDLMDDHARSKVTARELARLEKQKRLAATLRIKADAEETGEDVERRKNWEYSIEDNERWEAKLENRKVQDGLFHDEADFASKRYERDVRKTKHDIDGYNRQKELALGLAPGTLAPVLAEPAAGSRASAALSAREDLYRGADTLTYGDNKPTDDQIDRVIGKMNENKGKAEKKKKRKDDTGEVNYINERNKVFNQKINRYFNKYTTEIRENFERGTAL